MLLRTCVCVCVCVYVKRPVIPGAPSHQIGLLQETLMFRRRVWCCGILLLLLLSSSSSSLSLSLSPLYRAFTRMSPRQTMSLGDTLLQLLFRFIVSTVYGAYLPCSYVGSDGLLRQHFLENVCSV